MKYFVLGALSSGLLLYGMSMIYGATGTLDITEVARVTSQLAGSRVRPHASWCSAWCSWSPASPSRSASRRSTCGSRTSTTARRPPVTLVIGSAPKLAAFAMAMRLLVNGLPDLAQDWQQMLAILAAAVDGDRQHHRHRADRT